MGWGLLMGEESCLCKEAILENKTEKVAPFSELLGEKERKKKDPSSFLGDDCGEPAPQKAPISVISETQE